MSPLTTSTRMVVVMVMVDLPAKRNKKSDEFEHKSSLTQRSREISTSIHHPYNLSIVAQ